MEAATTNLKIREREKMETSAYIALSRQTALRRQMAVVANNLANMNTPAFKGQNMMFVECQRLIVIVKTIIPVKRCQMVDPQQELLLGIYGAELLE